jgi:predicted AAA+ superfamily ATPase
MYQRQLTLNTLIPHKSLFLFGARQTGKSTLLNHLFADARWFNLLEADTYRTLSARPETIRQTLRPSDQLIIIDEIQKLPELMDEVHLLIERNKQLRFILTGSSARTLKKGGVNLLAGRAWLCALHPLVSPELNFERLEDRLTRGGLPAIIDSEFYEQDLRAYVGTYLHEEIQAEGLSRSVGNFSRFLEVAGLSNGEQLNFTAVANDTGVAAKVIREYYHILQDTLLGHLLPAFQKTLKRKAMATAKFYLFDVGIANQLMQRGPVKPGSESFGRALEHLIFLELKAYNDYQRLDYALSYWRSRSGLEVDFVINDAIAIEVKGSSSIQARDCKGIRALAEDTTLQRKIIITNEKLPRTLDDGIEIMPIDYFLRALWSGEIVRE